MPEAVIVATARSPIGRAFKGSLRRRPPRRPRRHGHRAPPWTRSRRSTRATIDDIYVGCAEPRDEHGGNMARRIAVQLGLDDVPAATVNRFCASSRADHADGVPRDQGRRGRRLRLGRRRVRLPVHRASAAPASTPPRPRTRCSPTRRPAPAVRRDERDLARPARRRPAARHLHRDGPDRRERRDAVRGHPPRTRTSSRVLSQNRAEQAIKDGFFAREITPITLPDGRVVDTDDGPRPGTTSRRSPR